MSIPSGNLNWRSRFLHELFKNNRTWFSGVTESTSPINWRKPHLFLFYFILITWTWFSSHSRTSSRAQLKHLQHRMKMNASIAPNGTIFRFTSGNIGSSSWISSNTGTNSTGQVIHPFPFADFYIKQNNFLFFTSRVCGRGNVFVVPLCVCVCVCISQSVCGCVSARAKTFEPVDRDFIFGLVVHIDM